MSLPGGDPRPAVLAIDGGNSKTDVALVGADGTLLAAPAAPGVPGMALPAETIRRARLRGPRRGRRGGPAPAGPGDRAGRTGRARGYARHLSACVANADLPEEERRLGEALRAQGWSDTTHVANDTFAVLRAGLDGPGPHWGVAVTCGAGINCVGVAPGRADDPVPRARATYRRLGRRGRPGPGGHLVGDPRRGRAGAADRAARGGARPLRRGEHARRRGRAVIPAKIGWEALLRLVPVLLRVAEGGDAVALDLVRRQAGGGVRDGAGRGPPPRPRQDQPVPVVLGGGVLTARDPLLTGEISQRFADEAPLAGRASSTSRRWPARRCLAWITSGRCPAPRPGCAMRYLGRRTAMIRPGDAGEDSQVPPR